MNVQMTLNPQSDEQKGYLLKVQKFELASSALLQLRQLYNYAFQEVKYSYIIIVNARPLVHTIWIIILE